MANGASKLIEIHTEDLKEYFNDSEGMELVSNIEKNTKRYKEIFSETVDTLMPDRNIQTDPVKF